MNRATRRRNRGPGLDAPGAGSILGRAAAVVVAVLAFSACATTTSIGDLMDDPFRYDGQEVSVRGEVRESVGFLGPGIYRLEDGTGSLPVVTDQGGAPRSGSEVRVTGTFRAAFSVAGRSLAVLMEAERDEP